MTQQHACPRAAYSNCHCVIARNLHVPVSDGDESARDGLAVLIGLPIGKEGHTKYIFTYTVGHDVMAQL